jgi:hypothetical protein
MDTFKIINFSYDRKTNITNLTCSITEKNYKLSFPSNPLLEVDFLEAHEKPYDAFLVKIRKIIMNQEYDFKTLNNLKQFYHEISRTGITILPSDFI